MRLSTDQAVLLVQLVHQHIDAQAQVWLFGSRVDDHKRGGDIDLYVETPPLADLFDRKIHLKLAFEDHFGEQSIDLLVHE